VGVGRKEHCWEYKWSHYLNWCGSSSEKLKIGIPYELSIPLLDICPKECMSAHSRDSGTPMLRTVLFKTGKICNQFRYAYKWMVKYNIIHTCTHIYTMRVLFSQKDEWNYVACRKMDGTGDHHVKQNKPDSEG
jgi:hypothetical protein